MRHGEAVFVDSGAWIALALSRDPLHAQAREQWNLLHEAGAKLHTSIPVVIETFTFLDRNANRDVALTWRESIYKPGTVKILPCELRDLQQSWEYFRWWSNSVAYQLAPGSANLSASLTDISRWTRVFGEKANASAAATAGFKQAMANLGNVGFSFGGGCFYGHGVRVSGGSAKF